MLLKIFLKMVKNSFDLAFNFHVKICLDLDLAPYDKVVEFKFLKKLLFLSQILKIVFGCSKM
jgi:hypothetical protein